MNFNYKKYGNIGITKIAGQDEEVQSVIVWHLNTSTASYGRQADASSRKVGNTPHKFCSPGPSPVLLHSLHRLVVDLESSTVYSSSWNFDTFQLLDYCYTG